MSGADIPGLREAVASEAAEIKRRDSVARRLSEAQAALAGATGKRRELVAKASAGAGVTSQETRAVEDATREAESGIAVYGEALTGAEGHLALAEREVISLLRAELFDRSATADADEAVAQREFDAASRRRDQAMQRAQMARSLAAIEERHLRRQFQAEIAACAEKELV